MQELGLVVPVLISQKLQDQIFYLCKEVWNDEWSGMLFYETEGEFGHEEFKIKAQELFPLDIGTQTYTEYQTGDPELIKFLMTNPQVRTMKKGHIHSHNNMGVFFSLTDNEEISENCGFHNFYLSLIVNNKNEMCAKIAFKAKVKSVVNSTFTFKNQEGKDKTNELKSEKEVDGVFVYKCKVDPPLGGVVEDTFKSRFQELRTTKKKKEEESKKATDSASKQKFLRELDATGNWEQRGLFDDVKEKGDYSKAKEGLYKSHGGPNNGVVGRNVEAGDKRVYSMLAKLLSQDYIYEGTIAAVLQKIDKKFYDFDGVYPSESVAAAMYFDAVEQRAVDFYIDSFPEDINLLRFDSTMERCIEILETYDSHFPGLVTNLTEALNLEIR